MDINNKHTFAKYIEEEEEEEDSCDSWSNHIPFPQHSRGHKTSNSEDAQKHFSSEEDHAEHLCKFQQARSEVQCHGSLSTWYVSSFGKSNSVLLPCNAKTPLRAPGLN